MIRLLLLTHLGMGDMLACNGMVRQLCERSGELLLVCKERNRRSVAFMYRDLPNLKLLPVREDRDISPRFGSDGALLRRLEADGYTLMLLGMHSSGDWQQGCVSYVDALYAQAGVHPYTRYTHFKVLRDRAAELKGPDGDYVFMHDDADRGFQIFKQLPPATALVCPPPLSGAPDDNIFDYCAAIERALAVHVIDSCFAHLVDLLCLNPERHLHAYGKNPDDRLDALFPSGWRYVH